MLGFNANSMGTETDRTRTLNVAGRAERGMSVISQNNSGDVVKSTFSPGWSWSDSRLGIQGPVTISL